MPEISQYLLEVLLLSGISNARGTQLTIEYTHKATTANVKASSLVIEYPRAATAGNVRASQLVIELPYSPITSSSFAFWSDSELMTTGVMSWTDFGD